VIQGMKRAVAQDHRGDFGTQRPKASQRGGIFFRLPTADASGDVVQLTAVATDNGLHFAMNPVIRATRKLRAILAPGALKLERPAHDD